MNTVAVVKDLDILELNCKAVSDQFNRQLSITDDWTLVAALKPSFQPKNYTSDIWLKMKDKTGHVLYYIANISRKSGELLEFRKLSDIAFQHGKTNLDEFTVMPIA